MAPRFITTRNKIFTKVKPKFINDVPVNNTMLLELIKSFIEAVNG